MKIVLAFMLSVSSLCTAPALSQIKNPEKLSRIVVPFRERLIERLNLYLEYERAQRYEEQFDLLADIHISRQKLTRESYPKLKKEREQLLEFKVKKVEARPKESVVYISGNAKLLYQGRAEKRWVFIEALLKGGEWYFAASIPEV